MNTAKKFPITDISWDKQYQNFWNHRLLTFCCWEACFCCSLMCHTATKAGMGNPCNNMEMQRCCDKRWTFWNEWPLCFCTACWIKCWKRLRHKNSKNWHSLEVHILNNSCLSLFCFFRAKEGKGSFNWRMKWVGLFRERFRGFKKNNILVSSFPENKSFPQVESQITCQRTTKTENSTVGKRYCQLWRTSLSETLIQSSVKEPLWIFL